MGIPDRCRGCPPLENIVSRSVTGFPARLEALTGKKVASYGGDPFRIQDFGPDYAHFESDEPASATDIDKAWREVAFDKSVRDRSIIEQTEGCPGFCEASVTIPGVNDTPTVNICGQVALAALERINLAVPMPPTDKPVS